MKINKNEKKKKRKPRNETPCHSALCDGMICGPHRGSFAVQFGDENYI